MGSVLQFVSAQSTQWWGNRSFRFRANFRLDLNFLSVLHNFAFPFHCRAPSDLSHVYAKLLKFFQTGNWACQFLCVSSSVRCLFCWISWAGWFRWAALPGGSHVRCPCSVPLIMHRRKKRGKVTDSGWSVRSGLARLQASCFLSQEIFSSGTWSREMCVLSLAPPCTSHDFEQGI